MARYRKKPVEVEAWLHNYPNIEIRPPWFMRALARGEHRGGISIHGDCLLIFTLEGAMTARPGDWIIKGVQGELYPCKPDIFAKTYEAISS